VFRALSASKLAALRAIAVSWRHEVESFFRHGLVDFDLQGEFRTRGLDQAEDQVLAQQLQELHCFVHRYCGQLQFVKTVKSSLSIPLASNLEGCITDPVALYLHAGTVSPCSTGTYICSAPSLAQWTWTWHNLRILALELGNCMYDASFEPALDAIIANSRSLHHLHVATPPAGDLGWPRPMHTKDIYVRFIEGAFNLPCLQSLGLALNAPNLGELQVTPSAHLRSLHLGNWMGQNHVIPFLIRILPQLSNVMQLMIERTVGQETVWLMDTITKYCKNMAVLTVRQCAGLRYIINKLSEIETDGRARWLPNLQKIHFIYDTDFEKSLALLNRVRPSLATVQGSGEHGGGKSTVLDFFIAGELLLA